MRMRLLIALALVAGCSKSDKSSDAGLSSAPATPKVGVKSCADWGGAGDGTSLVAPCKLKGRAPITVAWTGKFNEHGVPLFTVTNTLDHETSWGELDAWYYDKSGKIIEWSGGNGGKFKRYLEQGGDVVSLKAHETKEMAFGVDKQHAPANPHAIEGEVISWGWETDPKMYFFAHDGVNDLDARPQGGWK
jgi:hypothetical protein